jgi:hypothetical protein
VAMLGQATLVSVTLFSIGGIIRCRKKSSFLPPVSPPRGSRETNPRSRRPPPLLHPPLPLPPWGVAGGSPGGGGGGGDSSSSYAVGRTRRRASRPQRSGSACGDDVNSNLVELQCYCHVHVSVTIVKSSKID